MKGPLLFIGLALFSLPCLAGPDEDVSFAAGYLQSLGCIKSQEGPFQAYHYEKIGIESAVMGSAPNLASAEGRAEYLKAHLSQHLGSAGKYSFNLALDPVVSASYGPGEHPGNWRLIALDIPAGARFFSPDACRRKPSAAEQGEWERRIGKSCGSAIFSTGDANWADQPACTELKRKIFAQLGVVGIRFRWAALQGISSMDWCKGHESNALILTDPKFAGIEKARFYDGRTRPERENHPEAKAIRELVCRYGNFIRSGPLTREVKDCYQLFPLAKGEAPAEVFGVSDETKDWMRANLLNCQTRSERKSGDDGGESEVTNSAR